METISSIEAAVRPLTKTSADGKVYERRPDTELQIAEVVARGREKLVERVSNGGSDPKLLDETLIYLIREAWRTNDEQMVQMLFAELDGRLIRFFSLLRDEENRLDEDMIQTVKMRLWQKLSDSEGNMADFAEVQFGRFIKFLKWEVAKREYARRAENAEHLEYETGDDEGSGMQSIENYGAAADPRPSPVELLEFKEAFAELNETQRKIAALLKEGWPIESKDPNEITISKVLNVTSRTIRNRIAEIREKVSGLKEGR